MATIPAVILDYTPRIDRMVPQRLETAVFGMGSFLGSEPRFGVTRGVWKTTAAYAGGRFASPSYDDTGDHAEVIVVEYDPLTVSYGQLLELFLLWHSPSLSPAMPRHASRIFVKNEFEKRLAQAAVDRSGVSAGTAPQTQILMYRGHHAAENWCQKYFLRTASWLMHELEQFYHDEASLIHSTLAMRLNGLLARSISSCSLPEDIELYDLSEQTILTLKRILL